MAMANLLKLASGEIKGVKSVRIVMDDDHVFKPKLEGRPKDLTAVALTKLVDNKSAVEGTVAVPKTEDGIARSYSLAFPAKEIQAVFQSTAPKAVS